MRWRAQSLSVPTRSPLTQGAPRRVSQVSDGAAAVLLMRRSKAKELGLKPLARFVGMAVVGVEPSVMGIGASRFC